MWGAAAAEECTAGALGMALWWQSMAVALELSVWHWPGCTPSSTGYYGMAAPWSLATVKVVGGGGGG